MSLGYTISFSGYLFSRSELTLPLVNPPISPGLQRHSPLAFSRSRATPRAESRGDRFPLRTKDLWTPRSPNSKRTSGHLEDEDGGVQRSV